MSYNVTQLTTVAECDQLINAANDSKSDLQFAQTNLTKRNNDRLRSSAKLTATLATVSAQITAFAAARDAMPEGPDKDAIISRLRRLNDRMENLEESRSKAGAVALLDNELERSTNDAQIEVMDEFLAAVTARKEAIVAEEEEEE
jgi:hypothetical protein